MAVVMTELTILGRSRIRRRRLQRSFISASVRSTIAHTARSAACDGSGVIPPGYLSHLNETRVLEPPDLP